jgi:hypothetical protein
MADRCPYCGGWYGPGKKTCYKVGCDGNIERNPDPDEKLVIEFTVRKDLLVEYPDVVAKFWSQDAAREIRRSVFARAKELRNVAND